MTKCQIFASLLNKGIEVINKVREQERTALFGHFLLQLLSGGLSSYTPQRCILMGSRPVEIHCKFLNFAEITKSDSESPSDQACTYFLTRYVYRYVYYGLPFPFSSQRKI